jgi:hypothetical protein
MKTSNYVETGTARDIETIIRLRPWIEDFVKSKHGHFSKTELFTDYNAKSNIFFFKILFHK